MRSEYINANKWHSRACTQFIHTLDTENDVLHTMNVHCVQTSEEFSILMYVYMPSAENVTFTQ